MALNLNSSPYYDNFDSTKNYNRILFKPGVAVQARELTQLQTVLSDQLSQLSSFTLKDGAIISGCEEKITVVKYVKIKDSDFSGSAIANTDLASYIGSKVLGSITGLTAQIIDVRKGTEAENPQTKTLYISYTGRGDSVNKVFSMNETLTVSSNNSVLNGMQFVTIDSGAAPVGSNTRYEGTAPRIQLSAGIIYARGTFIRTTDLSAYIDPFVVRADKNIGFYITESIVTSSIDETLLDVAQGSFNFNAPGADRLKLTASLRSYNYRESDGSKSIPENFYQYAAYRNGNIITSNIKTDPLKGLGDVLAKRAYEANGSYNIKGLQTVVHEHLNNGVNSGYFSVSAGGDADKFVFSITPGTANVAGYPIETRKELPLIVDKPKDTKIENSVSQTTAYGNYTLVNEVCGIWDVDGGASVDLYDTAVTAVTSASFASTSVAGNKIGTAKVRYLTLNSGTAGAAAAQYRLYFYDIKMSASTFKDVKTIHYANSTSNAFADTVLNSNSEAVIQEGNYNRLVWELPYGNLETLKADASAYDFDFKYINEFDASVDSGTGQITLAGPSAQQTFFFSASPTDTEIRANIQAVAVDAFTAGGVSYAAGEYIDLTHSSVTVTRPSESQLIVTFSSAPASNANVRVYVNMQYSDGVAPITKTRIQDNFVKIQTDAAGYSVASGWWSLGVTDLIKIKLITATTNADYETGAINITNDFIVDNGQRDNYYGLAKIKQKASSSVDLSTYKYVSVKFDYLTRTVNGPSFACVDSYTGTGLGLQEIPLYSPAAGNIIDLRNCIDFRPYVNNTAVEAATLASATLNPDITETIVRPAQGLSNPVPIATFTTDLSYYLAQAFKVVITDSGTIKVLKSQSADYPKFPEAPANSLTIAKGILPPYPALSVKAANYYKRSDLKIYIEQVRTKRYTMRDIGGLEERIANLEYYTALSLLEKEAKSVQILDTNGIDRFKNGLMIDAFKGYGTVAVGHEDNACSLDLKRQQMRASFDSSIVGFKPIVTDTTMGQSGDLFHIPYVETTFTKQLQASKFRNVVGELLYANPETVNPVTPDPVPAPVIPAPPPVVVVDPRPEPRPLEVDYQLIRTTGATVNEGNSCTISLEVRNLENANGQTIPYTITGISSADIGGASLTGAFTLDAVGDSSVTFNIAADATTEGTETLTLTLDSITMGGNAVSTSVTINDTSLDPVIVPAPPVAPVVPPPALGPYRGSLNLVPSEDSWFDDSYAEAAYKNEQGSWDNLEITGDWKDTWGSWELVSEDIINAETIITEGEIGIPPKGYGGSLGPTSIDFETKEEASGYWQQEVHTYTGRRQKYDITTTVAGQNTQTWERTGSRIFYGNIPDEVTENIGDSVINTEVAAFVRPIAISGSVQALMPNATHNIVMGGVNKGSLTTNANGRADFSISVNKGEFRCGNILIEISDANKLDDIESYAAASFTANGTKRTFQTTYVTTKWPAPPMVPESLFDAKKEIIPIGEDGRTMTKKGDVIIDTHRENVGEPIWIPVEDVFVSGGCSIGTPGSREDTYRRFDGTTYGVTTVDSSCATSTTTISSAGTITLVPEVVTICTFPEAETFNTVTNTIVVNDTAITDVTIFDVGGNTNTGGNASGVVTVDLANGVNLVAAGLDEYDFVPGVTTTEGRFMAASEAAGIQIMGPFAVETNTVSAETPDPLLSIKVAQATSVFDFSNWKFPGIGEINLCMVGRDPLAQTFFVTGMPGGMFVPSVDIFFKRIPPEENNNGITLQIREVVNGVPGKQVIPNGEVFLRRSDVKASINGVSGSVEFISTKFRFQHLVHLENDTEYCIVLMPEANDPNYEAWVGELGEIEKNTANRITKQAHGGVLFTSANNRSWTPHQSEDLMFIVNRCKFTSNTDFVLNTTNKNTDWIVFDNSTWKQSVQPKFDLLSFVHGFTFTISGGGTGYTDGTYTGVSITGGGGSGGELSYVVSGGIVTSVTLTNPGTGYTSNPTVALTQGSPTTAATVTVRLNRAKVKYFDSAYKTYELEVTNGYFTAADLVGNASTTVNIGSINNRVVDAHVLKLSTANAGELGTIKKEIALTNTGAASANTTYSVVDVNSTTELEEEKTIYSYSNEQTLYATNKTARVRFTVRTPLNNLSPIIDIASMDMGVYKNKINYPKDISGNSIVAEEVRFGGNASAKYISRQVVLADKQDAEDMRVFLDNKIPNNASVEVYGKFRNSEDDAEFNNDIYWKKLEVETSPKVATENFAQYVYKIPAKGSTNAGVNAGTGVFEYDVYRVSAIAVSAGGSGYSATAPTVSLVHSEGTGYGATAEAIISGGAVTGIKITNPGRDYEGGTVTATINPDGDGAGATAGAVTVTPVTFKSFKDFSIKIVHLSGNTAKIPKSSGLRAYALQV